MARRPTTTRWLERAGLDVESWTAFHVRDLLRQDRADQIDALLEAHREAIAITDQAFTAEGFCSDAFSGMSQTLAGRVNGIAGLADNGATMLAVLYTGIMVDKYGWKPVFFGVGLLPFLAMASLFLVLRRIEPATFK